MVQVLSKNLHKLLIFLRFISPKDHKCIVLGFVVDLNFQILSFFDESVTISVSLVFLDVVAHAREQMLSETNLPVLRG